MEEILEIFQEANEAFPPEVWCGVGVAFAVFILGIVVSVKTDIFKGRVAGKIEQAKADGTVIIGKRKTRRFYDNNSDRAQRKYVAGYEYELNGKKGYYKVVSGTEPPSTISLYYVKGSRKVYSTYDDKGSPFVVLVYILPLIAGVATCFALGYTG